MARAKAILKSREEEANQKQSLIVEEVISEEPIQKKPESAESKSAEESKSESKEKQQQQDLFAKTHRIIQVSVDNLQCLNVS